MNPILYGSDNKKNYRLLACAPFHTQRKIHHFVEQRYSIEKLYLWQCIKIKKDSSVRILKHLMTVEEKACSKIIIH